MSLRAPDNRPPPEAEKPPGFFGRMAGDFRRFAARDMRDHFWRILDYFEERPRIRRRLLIGIPLFAVVVGLGYWGYGRWTTNNSLRFARQWLAGGRLDRAQSALQDALVDHPENPEAWQLASDLSWKKGMKSASVEYAKKAAKVSGYEADYVIAWGEAALLAGDNNETSLALASLDSATAHSSSRALRLSGESYRRKGQFLAAKGQFEQARQIDSKSPDVSLAIDEVPLGITLIRTRAPGDDARGVELLSRWASDQRWGAEALRSLLADGLNKKDKVAMVKWAEALRSNPGFKVSDISNCLEAVSLSDEAKFQAMVGPIENDCSKTPEHSAELVTWLNNIGRSDEALRWSATLPKDGSRRPPMCVAIAESLRSRSQWSDLDAWIKKCTWTNDLTFLSWAYAMAAAQHLDDPSRAADLWQTIQSDALTNGTHAVFVADTLYTWGFHDQAVSLLWTAADHRGFATVALGTLARIYQVQRDALGQFKVFSRLASVRPNDLDVENNLAFFGCVTGQGSLYETQKAMKDIFEAHPQNINFRATYAFVLCCASRPADALNVIGPVKDSWHTSDVVAFAYGATLAGLDRKNEAKAVFYSINPDSLTTQEVDWVENAIK